MTRRILWFATAYTLVIIVHECAHAFTAYGLGLEATLFNFWVDVDSPASVTQRAAFGIAGPLSSLIGGVVSWFAYRRFQRTAAAMPLLYLAAHGVSNFFGNLMSAAFVGDFSNVSLWLGLPMGVRYAMSAGGALVTATVLYVAGRLLAPRTPPPASRGAVALPGVVLPAAVGTALIIVVNQPTQLPGFVAARIGEGSFWVFAAAGAFMAPGGSVPDNGTVELHWQDIAIAVVVVAVVRVMVLGIPLIP